MEEKENENVQKENKKRIQNNELKEFAIGVLVFAVGLFMLSMKVRVNSGWYGFYFGSFYMPSGIVIMPLIIGVIWYFANPKSNLSKIVMGLGVIFIVVSIIMSVRLTFTSSTLFEYILIVLLIAAGLGLILKTVFTDKKEEN